MLGNWLRVRALFLLPLWAADFAYAVTLRQGASQAPAAPIRVYVHVPKCAGTSFSQAMGFASGGHQWWPIDMVASGCGLPFKTGAWQDLVYAIHCGVSELESCIRSGNACFWDYAGMPPAGTSCPASVPTKAPLRFVMMIRDPVQRTLSEYYFMKLLIAQSVNKTETDTFSQLLAQRIWTHPVRNIAMARTLMDWVTARGNPAHNAITKAVVTGEAGLPAPVLRQTGGHVSSCAAFDNEDYTSHWQKYYGGAHAHDVEAAINSDNNLLSLATGVIETQFDFVGLAEYFDESVFRLTSLLGVSVAVDYGSGVDQHASKRPSQTEIPQSVIQEIRERNRLDIGLYRAVVHSKFWIGSAAAVNFLETRNSTSAAHFTWESVVDGAREGAVFDQAVLDATI